VVLVDHQVVDFGALANGRPDPGETVDLAATLRNFGAAAADVLVELETTDPDITIIDGSADVGAVAEGEIVDTGADPFSFEVAADAQTGRIVEFTVRATFAGGQTTSSLALCIGKFDYLVWDPTGDQSSGPIIADTLASFGYSGRFFDTLPLDRLDDYATMWVSLGVYASNFVVDSTAPEGPAIAAFMAGGGCVYLEGGDTWAYDPQYGAFDFGPHFGIAGVLDGSGDLSHVVGVPGEFSAGMDFMYAGENSFIDHLGAVGDGFPLFGNSTPAYDCGIAADAGVYRTVGTSFEFGGLQDGTGPSTRATLAHAVMDFFEIPPRDILFADGFEGGACTAWSVAVP
jgi:hypothetical protein